MIGILDFMLILGAAAIGMLLSRGAIDPAGNSNGIRYCTPAIVQM